MGAYVLVVVLLLVLEQLVEEERVEKVAAGRTIPRQAAQQRVAVLQ